MADYKASIRWQRGGAVFTDNRYSRAHQWQFDEGYEVQASASPHIVPLPFSREDAVDPEEAFVAALSSCHMLWFLSIAAKRNFCVDAYHDDACGKMHEDAAGRLSITEVILRPKAVFSGEHSPSETDIQHMHEEAHRECFIANSVKTEVRCQPVFVACEA